MEALTTHSLTLDVPWQPSLHIGLGLDSWVIIEPRKVDDLYTSFATRRCLVAQERSRSGSDVSRLSRKVYNSICVKWRVSWRPHHNCFSIRPNYLEALSLLSRWCQYGVPYSGFAPDKASATMSDRPAPLPLGVITQVKQEEEEDEDLDWSGGISARPSRGAEPGNKHTNREDDCGSEHSPDAPNYEKKSWFSKIFCCFGGGTAAPRPRAGVCTESSCDVLKAKRWFIVDICAHSDRAWWWGMVASSSGVWH